jgi:hypothetical protein
MIQKETFLSKSMNMGQAIGMATALLGGLFTFYTQTQIKLSELQMRIESQEVISIELHSKIDQIITGQNEVKVLLAQYHRGEK